MTTIAIPPRPKKMTPEAALRAAKSIVEELVREGHIDERQSEDSAKDIAKHGRPHMDGYELAKMLDECEYWGCDLQMAEILDGFSSRADNEIKAAQQAWAEANNIQPPFPIGARVVARWGGEDHLGTIDEVYSHGAAQYCVKRDGETTSGRMIVNFEDTRPPDEAGAESQP
jgi:hypothetical protein